MIPLDAPLQLRAAADLKEQPVLALDLGGTNLRTAIALPEGRIVGRRVSATPTDGPQMVRAAADQLALGLREARDQGIAEPSALGISAPGPLDPYTGVLIDPPNLDRRLWGFSLADELGKRVGLPAFLERDTQVAALAIDDAEARAQTARVEAEDACRTFRRHPRHHRRRGLRGRPICAPG